MTIEVDPVETQDSGLDDASRRHAVESLRAEGMPAAALELVAASPSGASSAQRTLDILVQRGMALLEGDRLVAIDGLSVQATRHRMWLGDDELFTWCALDAIGIPAALGIDAKVVTACPHCSAEIAVGIRGGVPQADDELVLWFPTSTCTHVVTHFCPDVNSFCNREHLNGWRSHRGEPEGQAVSADEAAQLGRHWWAYLSPPQAEVQSRLSLKR
jgi:alkylmercury lyase